MTAPLPTTEPLLRIEGLRKRFGGNEVLKGITLEVRPGEVVSIIGASGSGKSTFLRCVNVLEPPDAGLLHFENLAFDFADGSTRKPTGRNLRALRAQIGMVFQSFNLWPHKTVLENVIEAPIRVKSVKRSEAIATAEALLERIGLAEKRNAYPNWLSGGQQQRVAIVRALAMSPKLMLFDEVTSALDPELTGEVLKTIERLAANGMTMMLVTHEMAFARSVANRVVFMHQGTVWESGPGEMLVNPQTPELQQFVGSGL